MFKDITLGQYYPMDSVIHRLDPRCKLLFTLVFLIFLFVANNIWGYLIAFIVLVTAIILSMIPIVTIFKGLKAVIFIILLTVALNMFMTQGTTLYTIGPLTITEEGLRQAGFMAARLIMLITATAMLCLACSANLSKTSSG